MYYSMPAYGESMSTSHKKALPPELATLNIPLSWLAGPKRKVTISVPRSFNEQLEEMSKRHRIDKSKLYTIGLALLLQKLGAKLE